MLLASSKRSLNLKCILKWIQTDIDVENRFLIYSILFRVINNEKAMTQ